MDWYVDGKAKIRDIAVMLRKRSFVIRTSARPVRPKMALRATAVPPIRRAFRIRFVDVGGCETSRYSSNADYEHFRPARPSIPTHRRLGELPGAGWGGVGDGVGGSPQK